MATNTEASKRASLGPIWTNYRDMPTPALLSATSPQGLSPMTPNSLPSPMYPSSHDGYMRRHEQAMVDSFDVRPRRSSPVSPVPLRPIDEEPPLVQRLERISILPSINTQKALPTLPCPRSTPSPQQRREYVERSRVLAFHHGLPSPPSPRDISPRQTQEYMLRSHSVLIHSDLLEDPKRKRKIDITLEAQNLAPPPPPLRGHPAADLRDQLRIWGHIYYGNAKTADAFIIARSLRRHSSTSLEMETPGDSKRSPSRLTVRAIVRPRAGERQSFLIQRNFDMNALRKTISEPSVSLSPTREDPQSSNLERRSSALPFHGERRSGSIKSGSLLSGQDMRSNINMDHDRLMSDAMAVPIRKFNGPLEFIVATCLLTTKASDLIYAKAHLPVLAQLLVSGHVRKGDVIYLPLPHAEAWQQTVRYIYTGQGSLTIAIRDNVLYLAGKV
jgi:hypothetical protein